MIDESLYPISCMVSAMMPLRGGLITAASGEVPARPGVLELMDAARAAGLKLGVCSAATKSSAIVVLESLLGKERYEASPS